MTRRPQYLEAVLGRQLYQLLDVGWHRLITICHGETALVDDLFEAAGGNDEHPGLRRFDKMTREAGSVGYDLAPIIQWRMTTGLE